ncbi:MAG: molybdopterin-guanine dinucleotide biosynthesis protein A [Halieaceae bacterium]|jgi:molybdopterin-guanine dinucleotide biosynthesis protein A
MSDTSENITGLILAGGRGRRAGGKDKGLIEWRGRPLVAHVAERVAPQVCHLMLSCNRNTGIYRTIVSDTVTDERADYQGPLAGIESAAPKLQTAYLLVTACDTPRVPLDLAQRLHESLADTNTSASISVAWDGTRNQYLCALIGRDALPSLAAYLNQGGRTVREWYGGAGFVTVDFSSHTAAFENLNKLQ